MSGGKKEIRIHSAKFKTCIAAVVFRTRLKRELVSKNALLLKYLSSGSEKYPNISRIESKCMDMYGSVFSADIVKKGGEQILVFYIEIPDIGGRKSMLMEEGIKFLNELIFQPDVKNGAFDEERLLRAKNALREDIASAKDDKRSYAYKRFGEEMFSKESFGIPADGYEEDIDGITAEELYRHYRIIVDKAPLYLIIAGNLKGLKECGMYFNPPCGRRVRLEPYPVHKPKREKYFHEEADVSQGRLCIGFSTGLSGTYGNIAAGKIFSELLGGSGASKLYESVREKEGLAYYVSASFSPFTMCVSVETGIDQDAEKAAEIIKNEICSIKKRGFTEEEILRAKDKLIKGLSAIGDSKQALMDFVLESMVLGQRLSLKRAVCSIKAIDCGHIQSFAGALTPETVYFLGKEASNDIHS